MAYLVIFIIVWLILVSFKKKYFTNKYIESHKSMKKEVDDYENYKKFCELNNEIPLHKKEFLNVLDKKDNNYKELMK